MIYNSKLAAEDYKALEFIQRGWVSKISFMLRKKENLLIKKDR